MAPVADCSRTPRGHCHLWSGTFCSAWRRKQLSLTLALSLFFSVLTVNGISAIWSATGLNSQSAQPGPQYLCQNTSWSDSARGEFLPNEGKERHRPYLESLERYYCSASACLAADEGPGWVVGQSTPHVGDSLWGVTPQCQISDMMTEEGSTWIISTIPSEFWRFTSF